MRRRVISVVAPLLGMLGTVIGMILTFQAITLFGTGDPKTMAGGISTALMTTVLGDRQAWPSPSMTAPLWPSGLGRSMGKCLRHGLPVPLNRGSGAPCAELLNRPETGCSPSRDA